MTATNSTWTPEKIKLLKKLLKKGKSSLEIGKELGISKNAVIGKVHRLGLNDPKTLEDKPVAVAKVERKETHAKNVGLLDLKFNSCRWPIGEPKDKDFHFCGAVCQTGKPYCAEHCKIAYTSLKELSLQNSKKTEAVKPTPVIEETEVKKVKAEPQKEEVKSSKKDTKKEVKKEVK